MRMATDTPRLKKRKFRSISFLILSAFIFTAAAPRAQAQEWREMKERILIDSDFSYTDETKTLGKYLSYTDESKTTEATVSFKNLDFKNLDGVGPFFVCLLTESDPTAQGYTPRTLTINGNELTGTVEANRTVYGAGINVSAEKGTSANLTLNLKKLDIGVKGVKGHADVCIVSGLRTYGGSILTLNSDVTNIAVEAESGGSNYTAGLTMGGDQSDARMGEVAINGETLSISANSTNSYNTLGVDMWGGSAGVSAHLNAKKSTEITAINSGGANAAGISGYNSVKTDIAVTGDLLKIDARSLANQNGMSGKASAIGISGANSVADIRTKKSIIKAHSDTSFANALIASGNGTINLYGDTEITASTDGIGEETYKYGAHSFFANSGTINVNSDGLSTSVKVTGDIFAKGNSSSIHADFIGAESFLTGVSGKEPGDSGENQINLRFDSGATWNLRSVSRTSPNMDSSVTSLVVDRGVINLMANAEAADKAKNSYYQVLRTEDLSGSNGTFVIGANLDTHEADRVETRTSEKTTHYLRFTDLTGMSESENDDVVIPMSSKAIEKTWVFWDQSNNVNLVALPESQGLIWDKGYELENDMGKWNLTGITKYYSANTKALLNSTEAAYYHFRNSTSSLTRAMADVRGKEDGFWFKIHGGKLEGDNFENRYRTYQVGYNKMAGATALGVIFERGEGNIDQAMGTGDSNVTSFAAYAGREFDSGYYANFLLRGGKMTSDLTINGQFPDYGKYDNSIFSAALQFGRKFDAGHGWNIVPQAELIYGRLGSDKFVTTRGTTAEIDGMTSILGRFGVDFVKKASDTTDFYLTTSLYHEFDGDQTVRLLDTAGGSAVVTRDFGGTWWEAGIGFKTMIGKNVYAFGELERSFSSDIEKKWHISAGLNWVF